MRIKSIYINGLHNAVNKTYEFGDIVYIFGNNGVGKSTILQAIQLALLGYIPGTAKNSKEALLRHSPIGKIEVKITLLSDVGQEISIQRNINQNGNFKTITPDNPNYADEIASIIKELELPIFNFNEFVDQTSNKLKEYFIRHILPIVDGNLDWHQILADSIAGCNFPDRNEILDYGLSLVESLDGGLLDQVISANRKFKDEQSYNKAEVQRLQNTIDSLIYYDDYTGPTDLRQINAELLSANALRDQLIKYESATSVIKSAKEELDSLNSKIEALGGIDAYNTLTNDISNLKQAYRELSESVIDKKAQLAKLQALDDAANSIIQSNGICPYTTEICNSILAKIEDLHRELAARKVKYTQLENDIKSDDDNLNSMFHKICKLDSDISNFSKMIDRVHLLENNIKEFPTMPNTEKSRFELEQEIALLTDSKEKLQANIRYNETIENLTRLKYLSELRNTALTKWVKITDTNGLQTTLMVRPFEDLAEVMTKYIRQMYGRNDISAHFVISSKANSFSFGIIRDDIYIPYELLSSGEKCLYNLALMICIVTNINSSLKVLLCDDMFDHLDSATIENTFSTLKGITEIQFIFAGVKDCHNAEDVMIKIE